MESPVFTTRSGASASSDLIQDISRWRPGVRCASEMCSTRSGAAPAGEHGNVAAAQGEPVPLGDRAVREGCPAQHGRGPEGLEGS